MLLISFRAERRSNNKSGPGLPSPRPDGTWNVPKDITESLAGKVNKRTTAISSQCVGMLSIYKDNTYINNQASTGERGRGRENARMMVVGGPCPPSYLHARLWTRKRILLAAQIINDDGRRLPSIHHLTCRPNIRPSPSPSYRNPTINNRPNPMKFRTFVFRVLMTLISILVNVLQQDNGTRKYPWKLFHNLTWSQHIGRPLFSDKLSLHYIIMVKGHRNNNGQMMV